jgi:hypothetical protein
MSSRYLFGFAGEPMVPPSWLPTRGEYSRAPVWTNEFDDQFARIETRRRNGTSTWFDFVGELFPGGSENADTPLWQFVLLHSTWEVLTAIGLDRSDRLASALGITWEQLERHDGGIRAGLDVLISAESWGPVDRADTQSLDAARDVLLGILGRDGGKPLGDVGHLCIRRSGWGSPPATLQELGDERGVTRERIRQLVSERRWEIRTSLRTIPLDPSVNIKDLLAQPTARWGARGTESFLRAIGQGHRIDEVENRAANVKALGEQVRQVRGGLGFVDCRAVRQALDSDATNEQIEEACSTLYAICVREGDWIACSTAPRPYGATVALAQFRQTDNLPLEEVHEGIDRVGRQRGSVIPPAATLGSILGKLGGFDVRNGTVTLTLPGHVRESAGEVADWLFDLIRTQPDGVAHRDLIMEEAARAEVSNATIGAYLQYHFLIRPCGQGCYRTVGHVPSGGDVSRAAHIASLVRVSTSLDFRVEGANTILTITCGSTFLGSGVIGVRKNIEMLIGHQPRPLTCCASQFGNVRLTESRMMFGFNSVIRHLQRDHGLSAGDVIEVAVSDDDAEVIAINTV